MAAGVVFGILEFAFRDAFPTWSWMGYAYKLSLNQSPATILTIVTKIGLEIYHQTGLFTNKYNEKEFGTADVLVSALTIPALLLIGN